MNIKPKQRFIDATRELIAQTNQSQAVVISGVVITTDPEVFNPAVFFSSEWFAEKVSELVREESTLIEVGCGTGIVSIKSALVNPGLTVYATDINNRAKEMTQLNAQNNSVTDRVHAYAGDVFDGLPTDVRADSIFWAMPFGYLDPADSLAGKDSQTFDPSYRAIRKFFTDAKNHLADTGRLLIGFSIDIGHYELLEQIAQETGFALQLLKQTKGMEKDAVSMEIYEAKIR